LRTLTQDRWWNFVLAVALVPIIVLASERSLMADKMEFSIASDFEREEILLPGVESIVDTYSQDFQLNWAETYSSRLNVDLSFDLELEDIIRSLDVDEKTVTPSFEISMTSTIWDLSYFIQDKIIYSNEFNTARRDEIEFSLDISVEPFYLPPLNSSLQRLIDLQPNLEDKIHNKFDISTEYSVKELLSADLAWKQEQVDDRFVDNNDSNSRDWEINLETDQLLTQSLKMDLQTSLETSFF
jgi:hypothetical protein